MSTSAIEVNPLAEHNQSLLLVHTGISPHVICKTYARCTSVGFALNSTGREGSRWGISVIIKRST